MKNQQGTIHLSILLCCLSWITLGSDARAQNVESVRKALNKITDETTSREVRDAAATNLYHTTKKEAHLAFHAQLARPIADSSEALGRVLVSSSEVIGDIGIEKLLATFARWSTLAHQLETDNASRGMLAALNDLPAMESPHEIATQLKQPTIDAAQSGCLTHLILSSRSERVVALAFLHLSQLTLSDDLMQRFVGVQAMADMVIRDHHIRQSTTETRFAYPMLGHFAGIKPAQVSSSEFVRTRLAAVKVLQLMSGLYGDAQSLAGSDLSADVGQAYDVNLESLRKPLSESLHNYLTNVGAFDLVITPVLKNSHTTDLTFAIIDFLVWALAPEQQLIWERLGMEELRGFAQERFASVHDQLNAIFDDSLDPRNRRRRGPRYARVVQLLAHTLKPHLGAAMVRSLDSMVIMAGTMDEPTPPGKVAAMTILDGLVEGGVWTEWVDGEKAVESRSERMQVAEIMVRYFANEGIHTSIRLQLLSQIQSLPRPVWEADEKIRELHPAWQQFEETKKKVRSELPASTTSHLTVGEKLQAARERVELLAPERLEEIDRSEVTVMMNQARARRVFELLALLTDVEQSRLRPELDLAYAVVDSSYGGGWWQEALQYHLNHTRTKSGLRARMVEVAQIELDRRSEQSGGSHPYKSDVVFPSYQTWERLWRGDEQFPPIHRILRNYGGVIDVTNMVRPRR